MARRLLVVRNSIAVGSIAPCCRLENPNRKPGSWHKIVLSLAPAEAPSIRWMAIPAASSPYQFLSVLPTAGTLGTYLKCAMRKGVLDS